MNAPAKPAKKPRGNPTTFTQEKADEVVRRVSQGEPLVHVCRDMGIGVTTWYAWERYHPELLEAIARAREAGEEIILADTMSIVDTPPERTATEHGDKVDAGHVAWLKNRAEQRLKLLAKWNPRKWGDKLQSEVNVTGLGDILAAIDGRALKPVPNGEE